MHILENNYFQNSRKRINVKARGSNQDACKNIINIQAHAYEAVTLVRNSVII